MPVDDTLGAKNDQFVLTVAATGGVHGKEANPNHPEDHQEVVRQFEACYEKDAAIAHIHARDENGMPTPRPDRYEHLIGLINDRCPGMITQIGGLIGRYEARREDPLGEFLEDRMKLLDLDPAPDMITVNAGTFHVQNDPEVQEVLSPNSQEFNREFIRKAQENDIDMEFEIWDPAQLYNIQQFFDEGILTDPIHVSFALIPAGGVPPHLKHLSHYLQSTPFPVANWQTGGIGRAHLPGAAIGLSLGANARVGMEDTAYIDRGEYAESNMQIVDRVIQIAKALNRSPKPPDEVREEFENL